MLRGDDNKKVNEDQVIAIKKLLDETKVNQPKFLSWVKVDKIENILAYDYERVVNALEAKK